MPTIFRPFTFIPSRRSRAVFLPAQLITVRLSDPYRGVAHCLIFCRRRVLYSRSPKLVVRPPCPKHPYLHTAVRYGGPVFSACPYKRLCLLAAWSSPSMNSWTRNARLTMQAACRSPPVRRRIGIGRWHLRDNRHLNRGLRREEFGSARVCITPQRRALQKEGDFYNSAGACSKPGKPIGIGKGAPRENSPTKKRRHAPARKIRGKRHAAGHAEFKARPANRPGLLFPPRLSTLVRAGWHVARHGRSPPRWAGYR